MLSGFQFLMQEYKTFKRCSDQYRLVDDGDCISDIHLCYLWTLVAGQRTRVYGLVITVVVSGISDCPP